jgi:hypothetical protein
MKFQSGFVKFALVLVTVTMLPMFAVRADILVSNLDEPIRDCSQIGNPEYWCAQSFLPSGLSYSLTSIDTIVGEGNDSPIVVAELRRADLRGLIDLSARGLLTTFSAPDMSGATSVRTFLPDSPVVLSAADTYWFLLGSANTGTEIFLWCYADTNNFVGPGLLGNFGHSCDAGISWTYGTDFPLFLRVNGDPQGILLGDVNQDGFVNLLDVAPFVDAITTGTFIPEADVNQDGVVDLLDVAPFVELLSGH